MKNHIIDNKYKYKLIDENLFNNKYLLCSSDGSIYKKYLLVCYKENNIIKYEDIPSESFLDRFTNIIKIYNIEEIISACNYFDINYDELYYFHIDDLYFIKYLIKKEYSKEFELNNDFEIIINKLEYVIQNKS